MTIVYQKDTFIPFHLGDPAGIVFFGHVFSLIHETYESFVLNELNIAWESWFNHPEWIIPIKHTQASYFLPLKVGTNYSIELNVKKIGTTSFILGYSFMQNERLFCEIETVHVFCNRETFEKMTIPDFISEKLTRFN